MEQDRQEWQVRGVRTCVYDSGRGRGADPPVVMVHGGDPRSLANALDWSTVWRPDALGARLIAYDKPGQGLTYGATVNDDAVSAWAVSAHLEGVLDRTGSARVVLVGHSRGALPVADLALRSPERVAGLVLVSSNTLAPPSEETPADFYDRAYADPPDEPTAGYVRREPEMNSLDTTHVTEGFVAGRLRGARTDGWWKDRPRRQRLADEVVRPTLEAMRTRVLRDVDSRGFAMPVLLVWGQEDVSAPVTLAHVLFARITRQTPDCALLVLNRSGHYVYRERPTAFAAALRGFVEHVRSTPAVP